MEIYHSKLTPDPSSDEDEIDEVDDDEDYKKEEIPVGGITTGKKRILTKTDESKVSGTALQSTIKNIIDKNGSSFHFDTIVEHVKRTWQRDITIRKPDGNLYGHSDCKRAVTANLRTRANNKFVFVRDREHEGCFLITPDDYQDNDTIVLKTKPLEIMIGEAIEEHGGTCYLDDMYSYVENNWSGGPKLSKDELQLNVNICLGTNPKFVEEPENSEYFQFSNKKKRRQQQQSGEKKDSNKTDAPVDKRRKRNKEEETTSSSNASRRRSGRTNSPPPKNYVCKCGATEPAKGFSAKWRKGPNGELLCLNCSQAASKKFACPVCGKFYRKNETADDDPWIRCDDCLRWVMTRCDNISNLSIFDDSNPNHLHYSCPICRGDPINNSVEKQSTNTSKKHKSSSSSSSSNTTTTTTTTSNTMEEEKEDKLDLLQKELCEKAVNDSALHPEDADSITQDIHVFVQKLNAKKKQKTIQGTQKEVDMAISKLKKKIEKLKLRNMRKLN